MLVAFTYGSRVMTGMLTTHNYYGFFAEFLLYFYSPFRNHPKTVKQRFISAFCMLFISPLCVYITLGLFENEVNDFQFHAGAITIFFFPKGSKGLLHHLGLRSNGLIPAFILPLMLTSVLFLGPITPSILDHSWTIASKLPPLSATLFQFQSIIMNSTIIIMKPQELEINFHYFFKGYSYWKENLQDILWLRNNIVAPVSEEFTFRACMLPQLLKCYSPTSATLVAPLFFGVGKY